MAQFTDMDFQAWRESPQLSVILLYSIAAPTSLLLLLVSLIRRSTKLRAPSRLSTKRLSLFIVLALISLAVAGYYNYVFLTRSYRSWLQQAYPPYNDGATKLPLLARILHNLGIGSLPEKDLRVQPKVGDVVVTPKLIIEWLSHPQRLVEAGLVANSSPFAFWWTQQLVSILPAWCLFLGWQGRRYRIAYVWAFMVLARTVSASLAFSLFFVAVILSPINIPATITQSPVKVRQTKTDSAAKTLTVQEHVALRERANYLDVSHISERSSTAWMLYIGTLTALGGFVSAPAFIGTPYFVYVLAFSNALLFLPVFLPTSTPDNLWSTYKHLFLFILLLQIISIAAVLNGTSFDGTAVPVIAYLQTAFKGLSSFINNIYYAARAGLTNSQITRWQSLLSIRRSPKDAVLAGIDHFMLTLASNGGALVTAAQDRSTSIIAELRANPSAALAWLRQVSSAIHVATDKLVQAVASNPLVTAISADAALCWLSITAWVVTSSGFDDELAEESIEPALEAQETIKGLNGQNGRPGIPVRSSWFESHIG